jgi:sugar phosphate isomerase/epimerase
VLEAEYKISHLRHKQMFGGLHATYIGPILVTPEQMPERNAMNQPQVSIATFFDYAVPIEEQLPLVAEAGFSHLSLGGKEPHSDHLSVTGRQRLKKLLQQYNLSIDTIHGTQADKPDSAERLTAVAISARDLSVPVVVMHASSWDFPAEQLPERLEAVLKMCSVLERVAEDTGVLFAIENVMPGPATDIVPQALNWLNPKYFGFCYDSSHDQIGGPKPFDLLESLKERLIAVHLSDRIREFVDHVPPGEGFIDWTSLTAILRTAPFTGPLLFEIATEHSIEKDPKCFLKLAYERACQIEAMIRPA